MSREESKTSIDYDRLLRENLSRVFNEPDTAIRLQAIQEIYAEDATLYEPTDTSAKGYLAINQAVDALRRSLPAGFEFTPIRPAVGHHGVGKLHWRGGPPNSPPKGPVVVTGVDVAHFVDGRIYALYVFLDPAGA
jgi:hypothetical protein